MPVIGNKMKKRPLKTSADIVSGFTMGNEFNGLSESSIMCGTEFQEYPPFQDSPEDSAEELAGTMIGISRNILGGMATFASVLGSIRKNAWEVTVHETAVYDNINIYRDNFVVFEGTYNISGFYAGLEPE